jgi:Ca2+-binding RTX toxin-like protein
VGSTTTYGFAALNYRQDANYVGSIDLSGIQSLSFNAAVSGAVVMDWTLMDENERWLWVDDVPLTGTSTQTLNFSTAAADPGFDLSSVAAMSIVLTDLQTGESVTVTNLKATSGAPETGGNDILNGGGGSDFLFGQAGDDLLRQQTGSDLMVGGSGADKFEYSSNSGGANFLMGRISDFAQGTDLIRLRAPDFTLNPATATVVNAAAVPGNNRIAYDNDGFDTTIRLHPSLNLQIQLRGFTGPLTLADFVLFN